MKPDLPIDTQILWLAAELVEKGHCKGMLARRKDGKETSADSHAAVAWCVLGALIKAGGEEGVHLLAWERLIAKVGSDPVMWNNAKERTAEEVALALRTA